MRRNLASYLFDNPGNYYNPASVQTWINYFTFTCFHYSVIDSPPYQSNTFIIRESPTSHISGCIYIATLQVALLCPDALHRLQTCRFRGVFILQHKSFVTGFSEINTKHMIVQMVTRISPVDNIRLFRGLPGGRLLEGGNISTASPTTSVEAPLVFPSLLMGNISSPYTKDRFSTV